MNVLFVCWWDYYGTDSDIIVYLWEKGEEAMDAVCIGYPKNLYRRIPQRNEPIITLRQLLSTRTSPQA
jgi:hypothetical protein